MSDTLSIFQCEWCFIHCSNNESHTLSSALFLLVYFWHVSRLVCTNYSFVSSSCRTDVDYKNITDIISALITALFIKTVKSVAPWFSDKYDDRTLGFHLIMFPGHPVCEADSRFMGLITIKSCVCTQISLESDDKCRVFTINILSNLLVLFICLIYFLLSICKYSRHEVCRYLKTKLSGHKEDQ